MHNLRLRVQGHVQGVGYRYFIFSEAGRLGLRGTVRNLTNGDVRVIAEGEREALERLLERARTGPPAAVVTGVSVDWSEGPPLHDHFGIDD